MQWLLPLLMWVDSLDLPPEAPSCTTVGHAPSPSRPAPLNSRMWIGSSAPGTYQLRDGDRVFDVSVQHGAELDELRLPSLAPMHAYEVLRDGKLLARFTTADAPDHAPPVAPELAIRASPSYVDGCQESVAILLDLRLSPDAAVVRARVFDPAHAEGGTATMFVPPQLDDPWTGYDATSCWLRAELDRGGTSCVELTAIDLAGNESPPVLRCAPVRYDDGPPARRAAARTDGSDERFGAALVAALACLLAAPRWLARSARRRAREPRPLAHIALLANDARARAAVRICLLLIGGSLALAMLGGVAAWRVELVVAVLVVRQLDVLLRAHRICRLTSEPGATAWLEGRGVAAVEHGERRGWMIASALDLVRPPRPSLPRATSSPPTTRDQARRTNRTGSR
ncbi:MAG: hypothetical protein ACTHU0_40205 [Kofleriaceae bacterium]